MFGSFQAETLKLYKRPATWVIAVIFAVAIVLFSYVFAYIFVVNAPEATAPPPQIADSARDSLLPENMLVTTLSSFASFGSALVLVLGAMSVGGEYGWETFKVILTQRPRRLMVLSGKLLALGALLAVFTGLMLLVGAASSYTVASLEGSDVNWPGVGELLRGIGAGFLILAVFALLGASLATLFRGTALAIGLGLVYLLVLENIFIGLSTQSETVATIGKSLPAKNALDLTIYFGETPAAFGGIPGDTVEPARAVVVLAVYGVAFILLAALVFSRRDVT